MRRRAAVATFAIAAVAGAVITAGQSQTRQEASLAAAVHPADWGLSDIARVTSGRISLIDDPDGARIEVYRLSDAPAPAFPEHVRSERPPFSQSHFVVADFSAGVRNRVGGFFNAFAKAPSRASAALAPAPDGRMGLRLSYGREELGFCGAWIHFFDVTRPPDERVFLDATSAATLSFWVRGDRGDERVSLKLADVRWERRGDAVPLGDVGDFLPSGRIGTEWQQAVIPLSEIPEGIVLSELASMVLEGLAPSQGQIYLSRVAFSEGSDRLPPLPDPVPRTGGADISPRAIWIWNTAELLESPDLRQRLFRFLGAEGFETAFLQLVSAPASRLPEGEVDPDPRMRDLLTRFHELGIRVYALDGYKRYALPEYHPAVLATIGNVARFNEHSAEPERFYGVRYDIEPYLLPGFRGPRRGAILNGYLELLARGAQLASEDGLRFGADIPFWYDAPDEISFEPVTAVFRGIEKPVSQHVIDLVDDVAIMDYRTTAYGSDGIIRHAEAELRYASQRNKPAYVALETGRLPDETLIDFGGEPMRGPPDGRSASGRVGLAPLGDSVLVIWSPPPGRGIVERSEADALADLAHRGGDAASVLWWPTTGRIAVPGGKLSFAGLGVAPLQDALEETIRELGDYDSFAGFAIHYSDSYMDLLGAETQ